MKSNSKISMGILVIGIGIILLVINIFPIIRSDIVWPLYILIPVFFMISSCINEKKNIKEVIAPITTLLYLIIFFIYLNINSWSSLQTLWPHFLFAPAAGLIALFIITFDTGLLIPITILVGVGFIFFGGFYNKRLIFAIFIILIGIVILVDSLVKSMKKESRSNNKSSFKSEESSDYTDFE